MTASSTDERDTGHPQQRRGLAVGSGLVAGSPYLGTLGLAGGSGRAGGRLDAQLPFGSRRLACAGLVTVTYAGIGALMVAAGRRWWVPRLRPMDRPGVRRTARPAVAGEIEIRRPPEVVFDTVADERNEPRYNPRLRMVTKTTARPVGAGTRFRAEAASRGRGVPMTIEITEYSRPRRLASLTRMAAMDVRGTLTFEPTERGTRMRWCWHLEPHGSLRRVRPLLTWLGRRQERRIWADLKSYLEAQPGEGSLQSGP